MKFKCFYSIARVLALYVPLSRNEKIFIYARA